MRRVFAYTFEADISLEDMFVRLTGDGLWPWIRRSSDSWGDYIASRALRDPDYAMVKILVEPTHFAVNVHFESSRPDAQACLDEFRQALLTRVLPLIGAKNVQPTDSYE